MALDSLKEKLLSTYQTVFIKEICTKKDPEKLGRYPCLSMSKTISISITISTIHNPQSTPII